MRNIVAFVRQRAGYLALIGLMLCPVLSICILTVDGVWNVNAIGKALEKSAGLITTSESPTSSLVNYNVLIRILGWIIEVWGWLIVPLLIGIFVSEIVKKELGEKALRFEIREMGYAQGRRGKELDTYVEHGMMEFRRYIEERRRTEEQERRERGEQ